MLESFLGVTERWIWNKAEGRHKRSRDAMLSEPWERALKGQRADIRNTKASKCTPELRARSIVARMESLPKSSSPAA